MLARAWRLFSRSSVARSLALLRACAFSCMATSKRWHVRRNRWSWYWMSSTIGSSAKARAAKAHSARRSKCPTSMPMPVPAAVATAALPCSWESPAVAPLSSTAAAVSWLPASAASTKASTATTMSWLTLTKSCTARSAVDGRICVHRSRQASKVRRGPWSLDPAAMAEVLASLQRARKMRKASAASSRHSGLTWSASGTGGASNCAMRVPALRPLRRFRRRAGCSATSAVTTSGQCSRSHCTWRRYSSASWGGLSLGGKGAPETGRQACCRSSWSLSTSSSSSLSA
mmetsp:Transcript_100870/g.225311  ORF Transcript_100870/g.225311 Transcript_100870/m.225311 type:complete len:287 (-) Transcript_100870:100-960(-)